MTLAAAVRMSVCVVFASNASGRLLNDQRILCEATMNFSAFVDLLASGFDFGGLVALFIGHSSRSFSTLAVSSPIQANRASRIGVYAWDLAAQSSSGWNCWSRLILSAP